jgi:NAD(P)-dependent dehydrogenase (short-subunit alcohol dehydrogenase family)
VASVLITGASRGIGKATASRLALNGWDVYAGVRQASDGAALAEESGGRIRPIVLDITDAEQVAALDDALPRTLDAVVNNAGIVVGGPIEGVPLAELRRQFEVNVVGQVAVTQAVLAKLRPVRGRIVFVSSLSGRISSPMTGAYSGSKFALESIADALRLELRPWRVPVVLVEPAQTDTDMWRTAEQLLENTVVDLSPEMRMLYARHIDGQRIAIPKARKMAAPVDGAAETIERALTATRPKARYVVGRAPRVLAGLLPLIPTRLRDTLLASTGGVPRRL